MIKSEIRASLIQFLQLLVAHHPSRRLVKLPQCIPCMVFSVSFYSLIRGYYSRCRQGSAQVLMNFDELYPSDALIESRESNHDDGKSSFHDFQICGKEVPRGYWVGDFILCFAVCDLFALLCFRFCSGRNLDRVLYLLRHGYVSCYNVSLGCRAPTTVICLLL